MDNTSENINPNFSIELKKSLKRTIIQLQKAIDIINSNNIKDLPNLTIVNNLVESSNALVDYLRLKNYDNKEIDESNNEEQFLSELQEENTLNNINKERDIKRKKKTNFNINLFLLISLIISLFFNTFTWLYQPNINKVLPENNIQNNSNSLEKIENIPTKSEDIDILKDDKISIIQQKDQDIKTNDNINSVDDIDNKEEKINENKTQENLEDLSNDSFSEISKLPLTPEQYLLKNIKDQIDEITNKYGKKLILRLEANLSQNILLITVTDDWYKLSYNEQNNLVSDIFNKGKNLDFYKFNIIDNTGKLLARNAVIGNEFILTNRNMKN
ncbi:hypothetical protein [Geminocystis sp. NIES-3709]|uniref:hypothetical protein n=1 Tax=Geminocystis sp. NIES-3709 TaxID=1617448 RepID=UPI0005FC8BBF|nr:hypothetical protein [Geminocystis sp. NIES-3709]BAQ63318.1 DNA segregation ATPase FtsK/SpoIIIE and related proteins [Geminocystis sp. NIES-3709]